MFSNIEITNFSNAVVEKYVGWLYVSVNDVRLMELEKPFKTVVSDIPDIDLGNSDFHGGGLLDFAL